MNTLIGMGFPAEVPPGTRTFFRCTTATRGTELSNRSRLTGSSAETRGDLARTSTPTCQLYDPLVIGKGGADNYTREGARKPIDPHAAVQVEHHLEGT